jgi:hypothetical protein
MRPAETEPDKKFLTAEKLDKKANEFYQSLPDRETAFQMIQENYTKLFGIKFEYFILEN